MATPAAAIAAPTPPPKARTAGIGTDIAGAFAGKLAIGGASYLIGKLQDGALGSTGVSIGNFLSDAGLGGNSAEFAEVKEQLNAVSERLVGLQQQVGALDSKLDQLGASVANGNYSILVAFANKLRSAVLTGDRKLRAIAAAPAGERRSLAEDFVDFYKRELQDKELEFHGYLTGNGVPGAEGILKIASRKARSAAQPFFTYTMSLFPVEVANDYAMVEAVWLEGASQRHELRAQEPRADTGCDQRSQGSFQSRLSRDSFAAALSEHRDRHAHQHHVELADQPFGL